MPLAAMLWVSFRANQHTTDKESIATPATRATVNEIGKSSVVSNKSFVSSEGSTINKRPVADSKIKVKMSNFLMLKIISLGYKQYNKILKPLSKNRKSK
ncbi:hypothetical protein [Flavobacterium laiguense]|uniref:Uncharacterized protein n=1 Tax=Flavobacterium laiguense TaxID=2169409 RepID=A0A2U1JMY8_9FLAO|nr:hypothetical protein [Flavobacterium laiguense]PWA06349.1 hypothetical protein DB891_15710 [Flavobacterium laiguense]